MVLSEVVPDKQFFIFYLRHFANFPICLSLLVYETIDQQLTIIIIDVSQLANSQYGYTTIAQQGKTDTFDIVVIAYH